MEKFENFWNDLLIELQTPQIIRNWTANSGYLGDDFTAVASHDVIMCTTLKGSEQNASMQDFEMIYKNWEGYQSRRISRQAFRERSFVTKYTISIIHQFVNKNNKKMLQMTTATAVWIAAALLHTENKDMHSFQTNEIFQKIRDEDLVQTGIGTLVAHIAHHCVANSNPNPITHRKLYKVSAGRYRLYKDGDDYHALRKNGESVPPTDKIPIKYGYLIEWYTSQYNTYPKQDKPKSTSKPLDEFRFPNVHEKIANTSFELFQDGYYSQAIFEACKILEQELKKRSKVNKSGWNLINEVFAENHPIIKFNRNKTPAEIDEQNGFRFLFMGTFVGIRNPKAHANEKLTDPLKASEYLSLISLLMRRLDEAKVKKKPKTRLKTYT